MIFKVACKKSLAFQVDQDQVMNTSENIDGNVIYVTQSILPDNPLVCIDLMSMYGCYETIMTLR